MKYTRKSVEQTGKMSAGPESETGEIVICHVLNDIKMYLRKDDQSVTPCLVRDGYWEAWVTAWFMNELETGYDHVIDIGANSGYYAAIAGKAGVHTIAVEANPRYRDILRKTGVYNNFSSVSAAVSDSIGKVELLIPGQFEGSATITTNHDFSQYSVSKSVVPTTTLDSLMEEYHIKDRVLVKMDVEGAEEMVWNGFSQPEDADVTFMFEYTPNSYSPEFLDNLEKYGDLTFVGFDGSENRITRKRIASARDWMTLVLRKR